MMMMMVMRLHVVIQRHTGKMIGWFQVMVVVRLAAVIVVRNRASRAAATVIDAVDAVL
jgi:hypothetical protein